MSERFITRGKCTSSGDGEIAWNGTEMEMP